MEEHINVHTPENVAFDYQVAGVGSRFIAALVDSILLSVAILTLFCALGALASVTYRAGLSNVVIAVGALAIFGLTWGYYIFFELIWNGQTPGKRWAGLRVIRIDGTPITVVDSLIRNLVRVIDFMPLYYAVGLVTMFLDAQSRRLGDLAAGTLVIKEQRHVTLQSIQRQKDTTIPAPSEIFGLSDADYRLVRDFMARRHELRNRDELARRIASAIAVKLEQPQPTLMEEVEALLAQVVQWDSRPLGDL